MSEEVEARAKTIASSRARAGASVSAMCIHPIGTDLVAATALDTLTRKMGYGDVLRSLWREMLWILSFDCGPERAEQLTVTLAGDTGIFVNPNTHRHTVVVPGDSIPHGQNAGREDVGVAVWAYDDPQAGPVEAAVRERMQVPELVALKRLTLWWPRLTATRPSTEVVLSMVATHSRREGLLASPHYEGWYLVESPHTPAMLLDVVQNAGARSRVD